MECEICTSDEDHLVRVLGPGCEMALCAECLAEETAPCSGPCGNEWFKVRLDAEGICPNCKEIGR